MNLNQIQCPNCNANLQVPDNQNRMFCTYCGTQIQLDDGATVIRYIDEARIREIEYQRELRQHEENERRRIEQERLQAEENNKNARKKWYKIWGISELVLFLLFFICGILFEYAVVYSIPLSCISMIYSIVIMGIYPKSAFNYTNSKVTIIGVAILNVIICIIITLIGWSIFH